MTTAAPRTYQIIEALVQHLEQAFDGAGNAYCDPRWQEPKALRDARLWLAVHEAEIAGQKLAGARFYRRRKKDK